MVTYQIPDQLCMSLKGDAVENSKDFEDAKGREIIMASRCIIMGMECKKIINLHLILIVEDKKIIEELKQFGLQHNILYERFIFNTDAQKLNESINEYVIHQQRLVSHANLAYCRTLSSKTGSSLILMANIERLLRNGRVPDFNKKI